MAFSPNLKLKLADLLTDLRATAVYAVCWLVVPEPSRILPADLPRFWWRRPERSRDRPTTDGTTDRGDNGHTSLSCWVISPRGESSHKVDGDMAGSCVTCV